MSSVNYIIIPELKAMIEISSSYNTYDKDIIEKYDELYILINDNHEDNFIESKKLKDITINDATKILSVFDKANKLCFDDSPEISFFLNFLKKYNIKFEIINEYNEKEMKKYEKFKKFART